MYTIVVDKFDNWKLFDVYIIDTESNEKIDSIHELSFDITVNTILDYNKNYKIHKVVTVYHDESLKPYDKREVIINSID